MVRKTVLALVLICFTQVSLAEKADLVTSEQAVAFGNRLMIDISRGKIQEAWRKLRDNSTIPPERIDAFASDYNRHVQQTIQHFGRAQGVELIGEEAFGRSIMRVTYLVKYEVTGVAWYMYFYRMNNQWVISEFNYDINTNSVFNNIRTTTPAGEGEQGLVFQKWQEQLEQRLASLEANKGSGGGGGMMIDPAKVDVDNSAAVILLQMQAQLARMQEQLETYKDVDQRLTAVEKQFGMINNRFDEITYQLDLREVSLMRRTLQTLKEQHPFADFPVR